MEYIINKSILLLDFLTCALGISLAKSKHLLEEKSIKVNNLRPKENVLLQVDDKVVVYDVDIKPIEIVFSDNNIVVANKSSGIETNGEDSLETRLFYQLGHEVYPVHRLDRNTLGLVVFACNREAEKLLLQAFKEKKVNKFYNAVVFGKPKTNQAQLSAFLFKDSKKGICYVYDKPQKGAQEIKTNYKLVKSNEVMSLLEVELITGRTHQIRAHLSHVGLPVAGDGKYGNGTLNKKYKLTKQLLQCCKLAFDFDQNSRLGYLNTKKFCLDCHISLSEEVL